MYRMLRRLSIFRPLSGLVIVVGVAGGAIGAAYVGMLRALDHVLGPDGRSDPVVIAVLVVTGLAIAGLIRLLGDPGDVELLVDNIHVSGGPEDVRALRSLLPVSLLGIAAGGALGPEAPLVQTAGTVGTTIGRRSAADTHQRRILTITGMAAAFTVLFGAPLGSAIFALEILHRRGLEYYEALMPALGRRTHRLRRVPRPRRRRLRPRLRPPRCDGGGDHRPRAGLRSPPSSAPASPSPSPCSYGSPGASPSTCTR